MKVAHEMCSEGTVQCTVVGEGKCFIKVNTLKLVVYLYCISFTPIPNSP
jgi:hypothetical protein